MNRSAPSERHTKIQAHHLERAAHVYVRQSSPRQVVEHLESRRRQYERVDWAVAAGWSRERIVVVDEDQGKSGARAKTRPGFARLIAAVAQGEVGIVIALEVTRLSRNSPDWHHLLYLCRFSETLIADEHTVYDPEGSSDRGCCWGSEARWVSSSWRPPLNAWSRRAGIKPSGVSSTPSRRRATISMNAGSG